MRRCAGPRPRGGPLRLHEPQRDAAALDESRLEFDLADAGRAAQLRLVYQPYIDLAAGGQRGGGAAALEPSGRGEIAPGLLHPDRRGDGADPAARGLGARAPRSAAAARWPSRLAVSVNVSALQFHQPGFVADVDAALAASGVAPERLELEITETVLMRDNPQTPAQLDALIARGVRIALDDFGTGYSALAYLARLPHHRIKLDRAFVRDLGDSATAELVRAIIALARKTGVCVTAEGVSVPTSSLRCGRSASPMPRASPWARRRRTRSAGPRGRRSRRSDATRARKRPRADTGSNYCFR